MTTTFPQHDKDEDPTHIHFRDATDAVRLFLSVYECDVCYEQNEGISGGYQIHFTNVWVCGKYLPSRVQWRGISRLLYELPHYANDVLATVWVVLKYLWYSRKTFGRKMYHQLDSELNMITNSQDRKLQSVGRILKHFTNHILNFFNELIFKSFKNDLFQFIVFNSLFDHFQNS